MSSKDITKEMEFSAIAGAGLGLHLADQAQQQGLSPRAF